CFCRVFRLPEPLSFLNCPPVEPNFVVPSVTFLSVFCFSSSGVGAVVGVAPPPVAAGGLENTPLSCPHIVRIAVMVWFPPTGARGPPRPCRPRVPGRSRDVPAGPRDGPPESAAPTTLSLGHALAGRARGVESRQQVVAQVLVVKSVDDLGHGGDGVVRCEKG